VAVCSEICKVIKREVEAGVGGEVEKSLKYFKKYFLFLK